MQWIGLIQGKLLLRRRSPLRSKAGLARRGTYGPEREVFYSLRWTDRRGPRIKLDWMTRAALSRPRKRDAETDAGT